MHCALSDEQNVIGAFNGIHVVFTSTMICNVCSYFTTVRQANRFWINSSIV